VPPYANSCMFSLPNKIAPASLSRWTTAASCSGIRSLNRADAAVVLTPAVSIRSLSAIGIPCSGPRHRPCCTSDSARRASANADSAVTVINAFSNGFCASIRARHACVSSTGDTILDLTSADASSTLRNASPSGDRAERPSGLADDAPTVRPCKPRTSPATLANDASRNDRRDSPVSPGAMDACGRLRIRSPPGTGVSGPQLLVMLHPPQRTS
jgi:hypothetical protein